MRFGRTACFTVDVGEGGFSAQLLKPLPRDAPVEGSIQAGGMELPFSGQVAWSRPGDWHLRLPGSMGVRFTRAPQGLLGLFGAGASQAERRFGT